MSGPNLQLALAQKTGQSVVVQLSLDTQGQPLAKSHMNCQCNGICSL